ncbi:Imm43 family immunity protein [Chryseobacterium vaccae]|uniref:Imm43 family immunity protein n=1 Tax=Chryseobacterium vaccae TaxID=2604424 RepID=UPI00129682A1|nr:hypothetical protein [Chryseobacterium vaccae]
MTKPIHILDEIAIQWKEDEELFFLDSDYSGHYVKIETPIGKKHMDQVEKHDILGSVNLKSLFDTYYRTEDHDEFVPWMTMFSEMMTETRFAPVELDLGIAKLYSEARLTDVISGVANGWVVSKKLFEILKNFNIGQYQEYKIVVQSKKTVSNDYVYLFFFNYADEFVNYPHTTFYTEKGLLNFGSRKVMAAKFNSFEEVKKASEELNKGIDWLDFTNKTHIKAKEIMLNNNDQDIFKFKGFCFNTDMLMSARLAKTLMDEKITGLEYIKTSKVKLFNQE